MFHLLNVKMEHVFKNCNENNGESAQIMNIKKNKCPICGHYSVKDFGDICPVCFAEFGFDDTLDDEWIEKQRNNYKKNGMCIDADHELIRSPRGIELPGLYELNNIEAQNNPQYLFTKQCYENEINLFNKANHKLINLTDEDISEEEAFKIFNALAYKDNDIGLKSAFNLALCYASGHGCKKDLMEAQAVLDEIINYYEIKSSNEIINS